MLEVASSWLGAHAEMLIALCALGLSVQQGLASRRQERLSVQPFLAIDRSMRLEENSIELNLCNHGPGTAFIDSFELFLDGVAQPASSDSWLTLGSKLELPLEQGGGTKFGPGDALPPHSSVTIATYRAKELALVKAGTQVAKQVERIAIRVCYHSAFKETFELDTRGTTV